MNLINEIISNFQDWRYKVFDEGIIMQSCQFTGNIHHKLRRNFHSAFNSFTEDDKTIIVCCFNTYRNIVIFQLLKKNYEFEATTACSS